MKAAAPALIASPGLCSRRWGDLRGRVEVFIYTIADAIVLVEPVVAADNESKEVAEDWLFGIINSMETVFKVCATRVPPPPAIPCLVTSCSPLKMCSCLMYA
jgi:hypothetical protein